MEIFTVKIDGSFKFIFRKSLSIENKTVLSEYLKDILKPTAPTKIIKGVLTVYETPTQEKINTLSEKLFSLQDNKIKWNNHYKI